MSKFRRVTSNVATILAAIAIAAGLIAAWYANPYHPGPADAVEAAK